MLTIRTEGADVAGTVVDQTVTYHFVLALEPSTSFAAWAALDRTVVRSALAVHIPMRAVDYIRSSSFLSSRLSSSP